MPKSKPEKPGSPLTGNNAKLELDLDALAFGITLAVVARKPKRKRTAVARTKR